MLRLDHLFGSVPCHRNLDFEKRFRYLTTSDEVQSHNLLKRLTGITRERQDIWSLTSRSPTFVQVLDYSAETRLSLAIELITLRSQNCEANN